MVFETCEQPQLSIKQTKIETGVKRQKKTKLVSVVLIQRLSANSSVLLTGISEITFSARYVMPRFAALLCKTLTVTGSRLTARAHLKEMCVRIRKRVVTFVFDGFEFI